MEFSKEQALQAIDRERVPVCCASDQVWDNPETAFQEFKSVDILCELLEKEAASVKVLSTSDKWIGITYKEDIEPAQESFSRMITAGCYPENLWI